MGFLGLIWFFIEEGIGATVPTASTALVIIGLASLLKLETRRLRRQIEELKNRLQAAQRPEAK